MLPEISKIKGVHPGALLKRELKARGMKSNELAQLVDEHTQTISAIINERRGINPKLSIKLGRHLGVPEDYFMCLQASHDVRTEINQRNPANRTPNLKSFRKALFWDTNFNQLDWERNKSAIIKRIFERGNEKEIKEIIDFYGSSTVKRIIRLSKNDFLSAYNENIKNYLSMNNK
jgi:addiction module HigA family antidote